MKLIILALEDDNHTAPIKWALEKAGHSVVCWAGLTGWKTVKAHCLWMETTHSFSAGTPLIPVT